MSPILLNPYRYATSGALAADTFNRADAATLGTSSSGHTWTVHTADTWSIASNVAQPPSIGGYSVASLDAGAADADITVTIQPGAAGGVDIGLAARVVDNDNFVFLDVSKSGANYVTRTFQRVSGSFTGLTTLLGPPLTGVSGQPATFTLRLVVTGSTGESFVQGTSVGTFSGINAGLLSATRHGLVVGASSGGVRYEDFGINAA